MSTTIRIAISICLALVLLLGASVIAFGNTGGGAVFAQYCAGCHGSEGQGTANGPGIQGESTGEVAQVTRSGDGEMPAFDSTAISDADLDALAAYVASLPGSEAPRDQYGGDDSGSSGNDHGSSDGATRDQYGDSRSGDNESDDDDSSDDAAGEQYANNSLELICGDVYWASLDDYSNHLLSVDYGIINNGNDNAHHVYVKSATASNGVTANWYSDRYWDEIAPGETVNFTIKWLVPVNVGSFISTLEVCSGCGHGDDDSRDHSSDDNGSDGRSDDDSSDDHGSRDGAGDYQYGDGDHHDTWREGSLDEGSRDD